MRALLHYIIVFFSTFFCFYIGLSFSTLLFLFVFDIGFDYFFDAQIDLKNTLNLVTISKVFFTMIYPSTIMAIYFVFAAWRNSKGNYPYSKRRKFKDIEDKDWDPDVD